MPIYKISIVNGKPISLMEAAATTYFDGTTFFEQLTGELTFAIVRADNEKAARQMVKEFIARAKKPVDA